MGLLPKWTSFFVFLPFSVKFEHQCLSPTSSSFSLISEKWVNLFWVNEILPEFSDKAPTPLWPKLRIVDWARSPGCFYWLEPAPYACEWYTTGQLRVVFRSQTAVDQISKSSIKTFQKHLFFSIFTMNTSLIL